VFSISKITYFLTSCVRIKVFRNVPTVKFGSMELQTQLTMQFLKQTHLFDILYFQVTAE